MELVTFGSVSSAISYILGFQGFLCGGPECPEIKEFSLSPWGGPTQTQVIILIILILVFLTVLLEKSHLVLISGWMISGEDGNTSQSPGSCYTGTFECGLPQVQIFGGGGSGAVAQAVVNQVGEVIGANLLNGGSDIHQHLLFKLLILQDISLMHLLLQ